MATRTEWTRTQPDRPLHQVNRNAFRAAPILYQLFFYFLMNVFTCKEKWSRRALLWEPNFNYLRLSRFSHLCLFEETNHHRVWCGRANFLHVRWCRDSLLPFSYREHTVSINYRNLIEAFGVSCGGLTEDRMLRGKFVKPLRLYQRAYTYSQTAFKTFLFRTQRWWKRIYRHFATSHFAHCNITSTTSVV